MCCFEVSSRDIKLEACINLPGLLEKLRKNLRKLFLSCRLVNCDHLSYILTPCKSCDNDAPNIHKHDICCSYFASVFRGQ